MIGLLQHAQSIASGGLPSNLSIRTSLLYSLDYTEVDLPQLDVKSQAVPLLNSYSVPAFVALRERG
jgi:hypothetical protein